MVLLVHSSKRIKIDCISNINKDTFMNFVNEINYTFRHLFHKLTKLLLLYYMSIKFKKKSTNFDANLC